MEYGLIPKINQYADNNEVLIQQVQASSQTAKLKDNVEAKYLEQEKVLEQVDGISTPEELAKSSETQAIKSNVNESYHEVVLTNLNFGFNDSSRDFFVKAIRGEAENQYPTDEMMRLKAYFIAQAETETSS